MDVDLLRKGNFNKKRRIFKLVHDKGQLYARRTEVIGLIERSISSITITVAYLLSIQPTR